MNIFVLTPTIGWTWPLLWPYALAAAAGLGYRELTDAHGLFRGEVTRKLENLRRESVAIDEILTEVVADEVGRDERIQFTRDDLILVFRRDARGRFFVEVAGPADKTALDLRLRAEEFAVEIIRKFAYHKMAEQLARAGAEVIEETVSEDGRITLKARKWS